MIEAWLGSGPVLSRMHSSEVKIKHFDTNPIALTRKGLVERPTA